MSFSALRVVPIARGAALPGSPSVAPTMPVLLTFGRIPLVVGMAVAFMLGAPWVSVAFLSIFVVADIFDGDVARKLNLETSLRRLADGVIDRLSVHFVLGIVAVSVELLWIPWALLAIRDAFQALIGLRVLREKRIVVAGAKWHRVYTVAIALWGSVVMLTGDVQGIGAGIVALAGLATLIDYGVKLERIRIIDSLPGDSGAW
ncbi:MAG: CDP-alcohol phosphatidyltransferase family protein [Leucobacter sp.]